MYKQTIKTGKFSRESRIRIDKPSTYKTGSIEPMTMCTFCIIIRNKK